MGLQEDRTSNPNTVVQGVHPVESVATLSTVVQEGEEKSHLIVDQHKVEDDILDVQVVRSLKSVGSQ